MARSTSGTSSPSSCSSSSSVSSEESGSSQIVVASRPCPHPGRLSCSSGPRGNDDEQRPGRLVHGGVEQLDQQVLRPVHVLDEQRHRPVAAEPLEEVDPRLLQPFARGERVHVRLRIERERLVLAEELLVEQVAEGRVGHPLAERDAAADPAHRLGRLVGEPAPELADEPALADARVADDRDEERALLLGGAAVRGAQDLELPSRPTKVAASCPPPRGCVSASARTRVRHAIPSGMPLASTVRVR